MYWGIGAHGLGGEAADTGDSGVWFERYAKGHARDETKSRFVSLRSVLMIASARSLESCRRGLSTASEKRAVRTISTLSREISIRTASFVVAAYHTGWSIASATRRRRGRKVEKNADVSQVHLCRDVQP
jgi:hypothetical protein